MNLDKIVKHGKEVAIVTAGLVGAVLGSGCNIETIYGMGIAGNAYKTHDPYAANVMGNALMREGEAKEGKTEVTVINGGNNPPSERNYEERDKEDRENRRGFYAESCARGMKTSEKYDWYKREFKRKAPDIYAEYVKKGIIEE